MASSTSKIEKYTELRLDKPYEIVISDLENIKFISPSENINESIPVINNNYNTLFNYATGIESVHLSQYGPVIEFYDAYKDTLFKAIEIINTRPNIWEDFYTMVQTNSSKWVLPMTVFYPNLIQTPINDNKINQVKNWLNNFFPIRNLEDNTLNFIEKQRFIVSCYIYEYASNINVLDQPASYCNCSTQSGRIALHCQTRIAGGWVNCHQGSFNCAHTINCYPTKDVDCWYETPYLKSDGTPINTTDPVSVKQVTLSKIQANLTMNYVDRRETQIKNFIFEVDNCNWVYIGEV